MGLQVTTSSGLVQVVANTPALSSVASSVTSVSLSGASNDRIHWQVTNESTAVLYLAWGAVASLSAYTVRIPPNGFYELPMAGVKPYSGAISGIWDAANGFARITVGS